MNAKSAARLFHLMLALFLAAGMLACGELDEEVETTEGIEVAGTWDTPFSDDPEVIDEDYWGFMMLVDYDNDERRAITQNPEDDEYNPEDYNLLVWTAVEDDVFYYCTAAFGLETEEEARNAENTADAEDLDGEGCGGFSWTKMTRQ